MLFRTLVLVAHMDDEALSCGALIQNRVKRGVEVQVASISGRVYDYGEVSEAQTFTEEYRDFKTACGILGLASEQFTVFNRVEGEPYSLGYYNPLKVVERLLADFKPDEVIIPSANDLNQDHRHYADVCRIALRPANLGGVSRILAARAFDSTLTEPTYFVPFDRAALSVKLQAVAAYRNEVRTLPHPRAPENIEAYHRVMGAKAGVEFAEAYDLIFSKE